MDNFEDAGLGWFWATDPDGTISYLSEKAAQQAGRPHDSVLGTVLTDLFDPLGDGERSERPLAFQLRARNSIFGLPVRIAVDGKEIWWSIDARPHFDARGEFLGYRGSAKDITASRERQRDATRLAEYDP